MAIVAISRQVAALGDEIAAAAAEKLGYRFVRRQELEKRIVDLGFPKEKLARYDERKPNFFAALVKDRDEYMHYLQTAVLEAAEEGDCVLIGRGSHIILESLPNLISFRFISDDKIRLTRLKTEFSWDDKQAQKRIDESDTNRRGFDKSFFNSDIDDPTRYHIMLNTGIITAQEGAQVVETLVRTTITPQKEAEGAERLKTMLKAQHVVNKLIFDYKIKIEFLNAVIEGNTFILQGVADAQGSVERALRFASEELGDGYEVKSAVSIIQNYKNYR